MFKVLIWDYTGISAQWLNQIADKKYIEVVGTIKPKEHVPDIFLQPNAWDWLLIFEQGMRDFFDKIIRISKLPPDKVIYALDMKSWLQHPKAAFALNDMGTDIFFNLYFEINRQLNNYVTCTVEGISYISLSKYGGLMRDMCTRRVNWAAEDMKRFHALAKKYYAVVDSAGCFLDIGANIGTTGIYFIKKLAPNLKLLAFEPTVETFKTLRLNVILNNLENRTTLFNCGLGDKKDEMTMYISKGSPGGNRVLKTHTNWPTETIKILPLDSCLAEKKIAAQDVKYIWIDTEGFEAQVLLGAKNLLRENPAPVFMECNLGAWDKSGHFEDMMTLLAESYSHFVHVQFGDTVYPLDALRTMERPNNSLGQLGDIFLIRKGAIE